MMNRDVVIREANPEEIRDWDSLLDRCGNHRVTHTLGWLRSLENSVKGQLLFLIYEKQGEIVACLPGILVQFGFLRLYGSPLPGWQTAGMGPVFDEKRISSAEIMSRLHGFLERQFDVHHIEIVSANLDENVMGKNGFRGRPEYTFTAPLFPDEQQKVFKALKQSARRNIGRGSNLGLSVKFRDDIGFVDEAYEQIAEVFVRGGNVVPFSKNRVTEFFSWMQQSNNLAAVSVHLPESDICIAAGLFTIHKSELMLWMWAHRTQYRWYRPTELMTWAVMEKAMDSGCNTVDFAGLGDFKEKFGARITHDYTRWVRSRFAWLTTARDVSEKIYRLQQALRGKWAKRRSVAFADIPKRETQT